MGSHEFGVLSTPVERGSMDPATLIKLAQQKDMNSSKVEGEVSVSNTPVQDSAILSVRG